MHGIHATVARRFPALASRDFAIFWLGHSLSLIGTSMQNTALPLLAYRISGRPFDLGLIAFALTLPTMFLALPGGVLVERWDKRQVIIRLQAVMMLTTFMLAMLTLSGIIQIWHIILLSLIMGIASAFEITARQAMLIELVGRDALPNAIALQSTAFNLSRVLGPSFVAGLLVLIPHHGEGWIFLFNSLSFMAIIIGLTFVNTTYKVQNFTERRPLIREFMEGGRYIVANKSAGLLITLAAILGLFALPIIQQVPVLAQDILAQAGDTKSSVDTRNSVLYLAQGAGALTAAFLIAMNNSSKSHARRLILGEAAFTLGLISIAFLRSLGPAIVTIALMGWGAVTQLATMNTLIQLQVPNELRGRVFSIYLWALQGITPLGSLLVGWMTQTWSLPATSLMCGLICLLSMGGIQVFYPNVRRLAG